MGAFEGAGTGVFATGGGATTGVAFFSGVLAAEAHHFFPISMRKSEKSRFSFLFVNLKNTKNPTNQSTQSPIIPPRTIPMVFRIFHTMPHDTFSAS